MSTITSKEKNMLMVTVVLVLYAVAALCYKGQREKWEKSQHAYMLNQEKYSAECDLIDAKAEWSGKYQRMCSLMPIFPYEKDVDTHWLNIMDTVASKNALSISRRQTGKEVEAGDVYELPIDCKNWEGTLESLVTFLYGLRQAGAMVDVRQLYVRAATHPGYLKGTFSLNCAYMRGEVVEVEQDPAPVNEESVESKEAAAPETVEEVGVGSVAKRPAPAAVAVKRDFERSEVENKAESSAEEVSEEEVVKAALKALTEE